MALAQQERAIPFKNWPKDLAYVICSGGPPQRVTWADLKAARIARQKSHLERVLCVDPPQRQAAYLWSFFVSGFIYGGWHLYIRTLTESYWISRNFGSSRYCRDSEMILEIMAAFPCGLLPLPENFNKWLKAFSYEYATSRKRGGKFQGIIYGWAVFDRRGCLLDFESKPNRRIQERRFPNGSIPLASHA